MRCPACHHEVGDAVRCPSCHAELNPSDGKAGQQARGQFRGRMDENGSKRRRQGDTLSVWQAGLMLLADPRASRLAKTVLLGSLFYIVLPLDFLPGGLIPVIGWLDDMIVGFLAWSYLKPQLNEYRKT